MFVSLCMWMFLRIRIVLVVIDRLADIILPLVDLLMLLSSQMSAIGRTISRSLLMNA